MFSHQQRLGKRRLMAGGSHPYCQPKGGRDLFATADNQLLFFKKKIVDAHFLKKLNV